MTLPSAKWQCSSCYATHDFEDDATLCCAPEPEQVWACDDCGSIYEDRQDADNCCVATETCSNCLRMYPENSFSAVAIEIANHCEVCNPYFTSDQTFLIKDELEERQTCLSQYF